jgi:hypothetical protein
VRGLQQHSAASSTLCYGSQYRMAMMRKSFTYCIPKRCSMQKQRRLRQRLVAGRRHAWRGDARAEVVSGLECRDTSAGHGLSVGKWARMQGDYGAYEAGGKSAQGQRGARRVFGPRRRKGSRRTRNAKNVTPSAARCARKSAAVRRRRCVCRSWRALDCEFLLVQVAATLGQLYDTIPKSTRYYKRRTASR